MIPIVCCAKYQTLSGQDISTFTTDPSRFFLYWGVMRGNEVFKVAVTKLSEVVEQTLAANGMQKSDLDWLVPHQANFRIIKATAKKLNMSLDQVVLTLEQYGNTSAATVPTALDTAIRDGRIQRGQHLLLEAFGGGFAWASALVRY